MSKSSEHRRRYNREYQRKWREKNREKLRKYNNEYMRSRRLDPVQGEKERAMKRRLYALDPQRHIGYVKKYARKNPNKVKVWARTSRKRNPEGYRIRNRRLYQKRLEAYYALKAGMCCQQCGEKHPAVLTFHHRDPTQKKYAISQAARYMGRTKVEEELAKTVCLCEPCHRRLHAAERALKPRKTDGPSRYTLAWQEKNRQWFQAYKSTLSCVTCGEKDPLLLDFHHIDPATKSFNLNTAHMVSHERLLAEIAKCEPQCCRCHRIQHWEERHGKAA